MTGRKYVAFGLLVIPTLLMSFLLIACGGGANNTSNGSGGGGGSAPQPTASGVWTWVSGSNTAPAGSQPGVYGGQTGDYGTLGVAATTNVPGGRVGSASWTDSSSNLWLFGGSGFDANGKLLGLNDLWEFDTKAKTWTWVSGSSVGGNIPGVYGTQGAASPGNVPGQRSNPVTWTDKTGNFWLFGGLGLDSTGVYLSGFLNDLWKFNPTTREWTWVSGSSTMQPNPVPGIFPGQPGVYGTKGQPSASNVPGGRQEAAGWIDSSGSLWLFGGDGLDSTGTVGALNDLWEFNPTTSEWTWVSGASTAPRNLTGGTGQVGVYGTQGVPAAGNVPGGRFFAASWIDRNGNLWLFGGIGVDSTGSTGGDLNDLWEFDPAAKTWTWMSGADTVNAVGVYGTQGVAAAANVPGARYSAVSWTDSSSNLWLFGGSFFNPAATPQAAYAYLNDVWKFNAATKTWTWMSGADTPNALGVYGTQGVPAADNMPGARYLAVSWTDSSGDFWLFGGWYENADGAGTQIYFNDLWRYQP